MCDQKNLKVWVTGGYFDNSGECFIQEVDILQKTKSDVIRFTPSDNLLIPRKGFTGATWMSEPGKSDMLVCGFCSLFRFSPPHWKLSGVLHQPCMNDLHHVAVNEQKIFIVNTGLETIDIFDKYGFFTGSYSFHPAWLNRERQNEITPSAENLPSLLKAGWQERQFSITDTPPLGDYYQGDKGNFHQKILRDFVHLNHVTVLPNQILATSLSHKCIYNVCNFSRIIEDMPGYPHDGLVYNGNFWITCVNGIIVAYKIENGIVTNKITYLKNIFKHTEHRGWCRGLMVQNNYLIIGITEIRKSTQHYWASYPRDSTKTGIICWDFLHNEPVSFVDLTERRQSKIFSIIKGPV